MQLKQFLLEYRDDVKLLASELESAKFSDVIANVLSEILEGIDKARGCKKKETWSREEVIKLLEVISKKA